MNCNATTHTSAYNVITGLTSARQQITLPFDTFTEDTPNPNAIVAVAFSEFVFDGVAAWSIGNIQFVCGAGAGTVGPSQYDSLIVLGPLLTPHSPYYDGLHPIHNRCSNYNTKAHDVCTSLNA
jgi:hypothetical protein